MALVIVAGLTVAGCGGSSTRSSTGASGGRPRGSSPRPTLTNRSTNPSRQPTGRHFEPAPSPSIEVSLPTLLPKRQIPKRYTCEGADVSLPARWSGIPRNASELAVFVVNLQPTDGKLFFDWAVAGLSPVSRGIFAGGLPPGVIVGRNSFGNTGYSICPAKGTPEEHYVVRVFALPHALAAKPGFDSEALYREAERSAKVVGLDGGAYAPPRAYSMKQRSIQK